MFSCLSSDQDFIIRLEKFSSILKKRSIDLVHHKYSDKLEAERSSLVWNTIQSASIRLDRGGIDESLELPSYPATYNEYFPRIRLNQKRLKFFCVEEKVIEENTSLDSLHISFSLGSHDAFVRCLLTLYNLGKNNELIFPACTYGLFYLAAIKVGYSIRIADADRLNGEKINLASLKLITIIYPESKVLYLDAKTVAGSYYTEDELKQIVKLCKKKNIFIIYDTTHLGLELQSEKQQLTITYLCQQEEHTAYAVLYTASKTYGLELGRVGFCVSCENFKVTDRKGNFSSFYEKFEQTIFDYIGAIPVHSLFLANELINTTLDFRKKFREKLKLKHKNNLLLLIAYIKGIDGACLSSDNDFLKENLPQEYHTKTTDINIVIIPDGGIQIKVDISCLIGKYFFHYHITSSEVVFYLLSSLFDVCFVHGSMLVDFTNTTLRISFVSESAIHAGMQNFYKFVRAITENPHFISSFNEVFSYITLRERNILQVIKSSKESQLSIDSVDLLKIYKNNFLKLCKFKSLVLKDRKLEEILDLFAIQIQICWKNYRNEKVKIDKKGADLSEASRGHNIRNNTGLFGNIYKPMFNSPKTTLAVCIASLSIVGFFMCRSGLASLFPSFTRADLSK